jgi:hypothetical protein
MADEVVKAGEEVAKETPKAPEPVKTIGEELNKPEAKTVPEAAFLEEKKARKALEKQVKALQEAVSSGASEEETSEGIEALAEEFNIDKKFLSKLEKAVLDKNQKTIESLMSEKLKPFEEKEKQANIDKVFDASFAKALEDMEEYSDVVNKDIIKELSLLPKNQSKTFSQLIEETYGSAVRGKRTLEKTTPRGGSTPGEFDPTRASSDPTYINEVMQSPKLKEQYDRYVMELVRRN